MNNDYAEFEKACEQIRQENGLLLDGFGLMLAGKRLAPRTIRAHRDNVSFFINTFLLYTNATQRPADGIGEIDEYLGDWFIHGLTWEGPPIAWETNPNLMRFRSNKRRSAAMTRPVPKGRARGRPIA